MKTAQGQRQSAVRKFFNKAKPAEKEFVILLQRVVS